MRVLLVEDDQVLKTIMLKSLEDAGHHVDVASQLDRASHFAFVQSYDAILLDLNLPQREGPHALMGSGLSLLRELRARGDTTPVLVLTARNRTEERIAGLDAGADDYLGKPIDLAELEARLRALARRTSKTNDIQKVGGLCLDRKQKRVFLNNTELIFPAREYEVLSQLMTPPGRTVSKKEMSIKLSDFDDVLGDNALETFISRLRKKIQGSGVSIRTLRGLGYLLEEEKNEPY
ncbi:MAG: response regulator transcription factor [Burkholderiaceae bacterium]